MEVSVAVVSLLTYREIKLPGRSLHALQVSYEKLKSLVDEFSAEDVSNSNFFQIIQLICVEEKVEGIEHCRGKGEMETNRTANGKVRVGVFQYSEGNGISEVNQFIVSRRSMPHLRSNSFKFRYFLAKFERLLASCKCAMAPYHDIFEDGPQGAHVASKKYIKPCLPPLAP